MQITGHSSDRIVRRPGTPNTGGTVFSRSGPAVDETRVADLTKQFRCRVEGFLLVPTKDVPGRPARFRMFARARDSSIHPSSPRDTHRLKLTFINSARAIAAVVHRGFHSAPGLDYTSYRRRGLRNRTRQFLVNVRSQSRGGGRKKRRHGRRNPFSRQHLRDWNPTRLIRRL